ncbi:hypothetical protein [Enterobacter cloacae complex sp. CH23B]|uniref:hypothetical protein n=1 Tax=Enterobacter cloacae complex sp. CH23B TaxID=2511986 RepID=UPI0010102712|nr:hypothetical protein [Enterobacter cloacae complex sp. CH23B]
MRTQDEVVKNLGHEMIALQQLMRQEARLWQQQMIPELEPNSQGDYRDVPSTAIQIQTIIDNQPLWQKKWFEQRPTDETYH